MAGLTITAEEITAALKRHVDEYTPEVGAEQSGGSSRSATASRAWTASRRRGQRAPGVRGRLVGLALNLDEDASAPSCWATSRGEGGRDVKATGRIVRSRRRALLGRVVNALGQPHRRQGPDRDADSPTIEINAPGVVERQPSASRCRPASWPSTP